MRGAALLPLLLAAACTGAPPPPDWQVASHASIQAFELAYLTGQARAAEAEFARARTALAATGRADLVARAELVRCAARVASLDFEACPGFEALRPDAAAAERAYAAYLVARATPEEIALLPAHHRAVAAGNAGALGAIADPFARLVAAGVLLRAGQAQPDTVSLAIGTASAHGWRRPLLAWLGVAKRRAEDAGDREAAAALERRMRLTAGER